MIGDRVKERRIALGLTQTELALRLGRKNKSTVCRVECGNEQNLSSIRISKYAQALNTSVAYLLELTEDPTPDPLLDEETINRGRRDGEILRVVSQLNDKNASLLKQFALTLLASQMGEEQQQNVCSE